MKCKLLIGTKVAYEGELRGGTPPQVAFWGGSAFLLDHQQVGSDKLAPSVKNDDGVMVYVQTTMQVVEMA